MRAPLRLLSSHAQLPSMLSSLVLAVPALLAALAIPSGLVGCGGNIDFNVPDASGDASADAAGDGSTVDGAVDASAECPTTQPSSGAACSHAGLQCPYPSGCTAPTTATCTGGAWSVAVPDCPAPAACPTSLPAANGSCSRIGLECAYGDDPRPQCRQHATCESSGWQIPIGLCAPLPSVTCPATAVAAANQACSSVGAYCTYPSGAVCGCGGCLGGPCSMTNTWHCDAAPLTPGCPKALPNLGTSCNAGNLECDYGSCGAGDLAGRKCDGTVWTDVAMACPG